MVIDGFATIAPLSRVAIDLLSPPIRPAGPLIHTWGDPSVYACVAVCVCLLCGCRFKQGLLPQISMIAPKKRSPLEPHQKYFLSLRNYRFEPCCFLLEELLQFLKTDEAILREVDLLNVAPQDLYDLISRRIGHRLSFDYCGTQLGSNLDMGS